MNNTDIEILAKLGISAVLGLIIGLERELKRKPVGLKTSLVICIVSCLITILENVKLQLIDHLIAEQKIEELEDEVTNLNLRNEELIKAMNKLKADNAKLLIEIRKTKKSNVVPI